MKSLICIGILLFQLYCSGQNLIFNPGFEEVTGCPSASAYLKNVTGWSGMLNHRGTPDQFYGDCDYNGLNNSMAHGQLPYEGVGYIGCFAFGDNLREYFTTTLIEPLVKDSVYSLEFYVLPASGYGTAINSFGVHFSREVPKGNFDLKVVPLEEHIGNPEDRIIRDTVHWTKISGSYTAKGGERYISFGNFRSDANTEHIMIKENCIRNDRSYILVDGVTVIQGELADSPRVSTQHDCALHRDSTTYIDERPITLDKSFTTTKHKIRISIWDDKRMDGDSVHLLINDSMLLKNHLITKRPVYLELSLEPGEHLLKLVALNLGDIPPNTAAIKITDYSRQRAYVLKSDLTSTEGIRIIIEE